MTLSMDILILILIFTINYLKTFFSNQNSKRERIHDL
jgi:hypothetical protein